MPVVLSWDIEGAERVFIEPHVGEVTGKTSVDVFTVATKFLRYGL